METSERMRRRLTSTIKARPTKGDVSRGDSKRNNIEVVRTVGVTTDVDFDMRQMLRVLQSVRDGDFSVRLPSDKTGIAGKVADTFNEIVASNQRLAQELERA